MANINLATSKEKETGSNFFASSQGLILAVFALILLAYGGLLISGYYIDKKAEGIKVGYGDKYSKFINGDSKKVLDFQNRLTIASDMAKKEKNVSMDFMELEKIMINGVSVGKYKYDSVNDTISIECLTGNYGLVARQIQSFKSSSYFSLVSAGESKFDTIKEKINFLIVLKVNKADKLSLR